MLRLTVCVSALLLLVLSGAAIGGRRPSRPPRVTAKVVSSFDHVSIHYRVEGSGSPDVVLIHCWMCDSGIWDNVVPTLAKSYRVVTLDLPGHGVSGKDRKEWSMAAFGADVATVVNALRLDRVILVGHSMGGAVMLEAAARMPGKVVGMIGVDTLLDADRPSDPKEIDAWLAKMKADFRGTADQLVRMIAGKSADPVVIDRVARKMSSGDPAIGLALMDSLQHYDVKAGMERAHAPMVGINSTMRPTNVVANRKYLPRYELLPLPEGVGHFPQVEAPQAFNSLLERAITLLGGAAAEVLVPRGTAPVLDGALSPAEWSGARRFELRGGGEVLLQHIDGTLYVGLRTTSLATGSICIDRGDRIAVLHSSAALGTAIYAHSANGWRLTRPFAWRCRNQADTAKLQAERSAFLQEEHWLANTALTGTPGKWNTRSRCRRDRCASP